MATRTRIFGFIRVKTMASFLKGTWKLRENIKLVGGGQIISNIKTCQQPKKVSQDYEVMHGLCFSFFSRRQIADVFSQA